MSSLSLGSGSKIALAVGLLCGSSLVINEDRVVSGGCEGLQVVGLERPSDVVEMARLTEHEVNKILDKVLADPVNGRDPKCVEMDRQDLAKMNLKLINLASKIDSALPNMNMLSKVSKFIAEVQCLSFKDAQAKLNELAGRLNDVLKGLSRLGR